MKATLSHRIALVPTQAQEALLRQAVGVARFAYNWALEEWRRQCEAGEQPNEAALRRKLNGVKREQFPWMLRVPKSVPQQAIKNCGAAFQRFFRKHGRYPRFKKKGRKDSARLDNGPGTFKFEGKRICLPIVGWVKMREGLRFAGKPLSATVSCVAGRWFVSVPVEVERPAPVRESQAATGVDLGVRTVARLSSGEKLEGPKALQANLSRLRRLSRQHSRKVKGSSNRRKHARKLGRLHARIANLRRDWLHKTTSGLVKRSSVIGIEDLNVKGMMANQRLARPISDIGFHEFRRQLLYKSALYGSEIVLADRWFPGSKTCSACGRIAEELPLSVQEWTCACGQFHNRDVNAARNLLSYALTRASCARRNACGEEGSGRSHAPVKPTSVKQESVGECLSPV
ncbi:MAG TPA: transposase [Candidatus Acidoferrales bacterium]|nr:transposase [Candidatus Acidoferrales bacterium]